MGWINTWDAIPFVPADAAACLIIDEETQLVNRITTFLNLNGAGSPKVQQSQLTESHYRYVGLTKLSAEACQTYMKANIPSGTIRGATNVKRANEADGYFCEICDRVETPFAVVT